MKEIKALRDGGRSLDITTAKRNTKKKKEIHPIDDGAWNLIFSYVRHAQRWEFGWAHKLSPAHHACSITI